MRYTMAEDLVKNPKHQIETKPSTASSPAVRNTTDDDGYLDANVIFNFPRSNRPTAEHIYDPVYEVREALKVIDWMFETDRVCHV